MTITYNTKTLELEITFESGKRYGWKAVHRADLAGAILRGDLVQSIEHIYGTGTWLNDDRPCHMVGVVDGGAE